MNRSLLKSFVETCLAAAVAPLVVYYRLLLPRALGARDEFFHGISQLLSLFPGRIGSLVRVAFYRRVFLACGRNVFIGFGSIFSTPDVRLADNVYIGPNCNVGHLDIGRNVLIGSNVTLLSGSRQHLFDRTDIPINQQGGEFTRISIGEDCWVGNGAVLFASVGAHSIVAAAAVVSKPVGEWLVVGGNPAATLRARK